MRLLKAAAILLLYVPALAIALVACQILIWVRPLQRQIDGTGLES
jgi:hypothetical protein